MTRTMTMLTALLLLTACETNQEDKEAIKAQVNKDAQTVEDNATRHTTRVANNVRDSIKNTAAHMRKWWLEPTPVPPTPQLPPSYCYKVMQDIVCYRAPIPGKTYALVGYQGDGAPPPPVAQTDPIPESRIPRINSSVSGDARVANAKPVFIGIPTQVKEEGPQTVDAVTQTESQPLPDPMLSPQL